MINNKNILSVTKLATVQMLLLGVHHRYIWTEFIIPLWLFSHPSLTSVNRNYSLPSTTHAFCIRECKYWTCYMDPPASGYELTRRLNRNWLVRASSPSRISTAVVNDPRWINNNAFARNESMPSLVINKSPQNGKRIDTYHGFVVIEIYHWESVFHLGGFNVG